MEPNNTKSLNAGIQVIKRTRSSLCLKCSRADHALFASEKGDSNSPGSYSQKVKPEISKSRIMSVNNQAHPRLCKHLTDYSSLNTKHKITLVPQGARKKIANKSEPLLSSGKPNAKYSLYIHSLPKSFLRLNANKFNNNLISKSLWKRIVSRHSIQSDSHRYSPEVSPSRKNKAHCLNSNTIAESVEDLPEPVSDYEPEDLLSPEDDYFKSSKAIKKALRKLKEPAWVSTPELCKALKKQKKYDPNLIFKSARPPFQELFGNKLKYENFKARRSSIWLETQTPPKK